MPFDPGAPYEPANAAQPAGGFDPDQPYEKAPASKFSTFMKGQEPEQRTSTTLPGVVGAVTRGVAPYAAGAALGAAAGAPLMGVGAIPGAVAGAGAVALADLASAVYNPIAGLTGLPRMPTAREGTNKLLDLLHVARPETAVERMAETGAGAAASAGGGAKTAELLASTLKNPLARAVATKIAERPVMQAVSGLSGGIAGQGAAELGLGPLPQMLVAAVAGGVPFAGAGVKALAGAEPTPAALAARQAGYVLPPAMASDKPSTASSALAGWSGKIKTAQGASAKNQDVTNRLAAEALGLPSDTTLTPNVFQRVRRDAGKAYKAVTSAVPEVVADQDFKDTVAALGGANSEAAKFFPNIVNNPGIESLIKELGASDKFSTDAGLELVKELRGSANANLKAMGDPSKHALGLAQRQAAEAVDSLIDRNIEAAGKPGVVEKYREARRLIAKSYDVEGATNASTGDVSAKGLGKLASKGKPLTDQLRTIADVANAFPKAMQNSTAFGGAEELSALDFFGSAAALAHGNPGIAAAIMGRPAARALLLSRGFQDAMMKNEPASVPLSLLATPAAIPGMTAQSAAPMLTPAFAGP